jgi:hypothetical protein
VAQVTISDQKEIARGFESRSEEYSRGARELALGWQSSSKLYSNIRTDKQTKESIVLCKTKYM